MKRIEWGAIDPSINYKRSHPNFGSEIQRDRTFGSPQVIAT